MKLPYMTLDLAVYITGTSNRSRFRFRSSSSRYAESTILLPQVAYSSTPWQTESSVGILSKAPHRCQIPHFLYGVVVAAQRLDAGFVS